MLRIRHRFLAFTTYFVYPDRGILKIKPSAGDNPLCGEVAVFLKVIPGMQLVHKMVHRIDAKPLVGFPPDVELDVKAVLGEMGVPAESETVRIKENR